MIRVIKSPESINELPKDRLKVALFGSIEMGKAVDWQSDFAAQMLTRGSNAILLNPRRDDWDSSWGQDHPELERQISWELTAGEKADVVVIYFHPATMAPVSLLELGIAAKTKPFQTFVCCPNGYWRKANVDVVCRRYMVQQLPTIDSVVDRVIEIEKNAEPVSDHS